MTAVTTTARAIDQAATMRAIVQDRYGPPERLAHLRDVPRPEIGDDGVLVRVRAASVNALDWHMLRGEPIIARFSEGLLRPKNPTPGVDVAGVVEAVGKDVTELRVGDEVFGGRNGSFAEYSAGRVRNYVKKPANLTFEQAAAIPVAAMTALQAVRDHAGIKAGDDVLILGAGGGVGSMAVQVAKAFGARVTATTTTANLETVRAIGADDLVDYTREDVTRGRKRFDAIVDVGGYARLRDLARVITPQGTIVTVGAGSGRIGHLIASILTARLRTRLLKQRMKFFISTMKRDDLQVLADLAAAGKLVAVIDRTYPLADAGQAIAYVQTGKARGKVVITV